jgi:hypothetical protein
VFLLFDSHGGSNEKADTDYNRVAGELFLRSAVRGWSRKLNRKKFGSRRRARHK